jgi:hypothetical protein
VNFIDTLKEKRGPFPTWVWAALLTLGLGLVLRHRNASKKTTGQTDAASNQANSNLGSAAALASMFEVAGLMPYQGGSVYVNTTQTVDANKPKPIHKPPKHEKEDDDKKHHGHGEKEDDGRGQRKDGGPTRKPHGENENDRGRG